MLSPRFIPKSLFFIQFASGDFNFRNNETEDMFLHQSNPVGDELFSYVNTFVGFMLKNLRTEI